MHVSVWNRTYRTQIIGPQKIPPKQLIFEEKKHIIIIVIGEQPITWVRISEIQIVHSIRLFIEFLLLAVALVTDLLVYTEELEDSEEQERMDAGTLYIVANNWLTHLHHIIITS